MVDELYGLETGCSKGAAGSMHLYDAEAGLLGSSAIVGGSVPIALGLALAKKRQGTNDVAIAFLGDGATDEGSFYEALNLAALLELPVLFVLEQNDLSTYTTLAERHARRDLLEKVRAFGVLAARVDGQDAVSVHEAARESLEEVRQGKGPRLLEAKTSRLCAHVGPAIGPDSQTGPYPDWEARKEREPLAVFRSRISQKEVPTEEIDREVVARVDRTFARAKEAFARKNAVMKLVAPPAPNPSRV
jgi:TPP-dependent pyruvate/acetoin dehydrogenase alpha subunit